MRAGIGTSFRLKYEPQVPSTIPNNVVIRALECEQALLRLSFSPPNEQTTVGTSFINYWNLNPRREETKREKNLIIMN